MNQTDAMDNLYDFVYTGDSERIDKAIVSLFPEMTRSYVQKLITDGAVTVNGIQVAKKYELKSGDEVIMTIPELQLPEAVPEDIPLDVFYEDNDILVINKPKDMVVHPAPGNYSGTLVNALLHYCGDTLSGINGVMRPGIVHRLDKDTAGLIIVAKNDFAHRILADDIKEHNFTRQYESIIVGTPRNLTGTVNAPIARHHSDRKKMAVVAGGRSAITHYEVLEQFSGYSHVRLTLETGRTHQIRVHMAHIGHPVVCDEVYGSSKQQFSCCKGQCLFAARIAFKHPRTGEMLDFTAPLPEFMTSILDELRAKKY